MELIRQSQLPFVGMSHEFIGAAHGGIGASFFLVIGKPGRGPRLHKHNYNKIVYVIAGSAKWIVANEERDAMAGDVLVTRAGEPHKFVSGDHDPIRYPPEPDLREPVARVAGLISPTSARIPNQPATI